MGDLVVDQYPAGAGHLRFARVDLDPAAIGSLVSRRQRAMDRGGQMVAIDKAVAMLREEYFHAALEGVSGDGVRAAEVAENSISNDLRLRVRQALEEFMNGWMATEAKAVAVLLHEDDQAILTAVQAISIEQLSFPQHATDNDRFAKDLSDRRDQLNALRVKVTGLFSAAKSLAPGPEAKPKALKQ